MSSRNVIKQLAPDSYYHVYARGASRENVFADDADRLYFLQLFGRYLSVERALSSTGVPYPHLRDRVKLLAYCVMSTHFHLLVWQQGEGDLPRFMRAMMTSYSRYFNLKYKRSGALFETRYKAARIDQDVYLEHVSRYIHLNPRYWQRYPYSSLQCYFADRPEWIQPEAIEARFDDKAAYIVFLKDYVGQKASLEELKHSLAS